MPICSVDRQGRAPARLLVGRGSRTSIDSAEAADNIDKSGAAIPKNVPSRDRPLGYGSARLSAYCQH
jgi:hypothetical protein